MQVFIAGIMQGSRHDDQLDSQDYRTRITAALQSNLPDAHVSDPWMLHPDSVRYDMAQTRETFLAMTALARDADIVIAYLPHASMGTAIEMWTAYHNGAHIVAVTPMTHNWVVKITADVILPDLDSLLRYIESGQMLQDVAGGER